MSDFTSRYGQWPLVAGASEGLGAAFAEQLAERGMNVLLVARREPELAELARRLAKAYRVETRWLVLDLADDELAGKIGAVCESIQPGLLVYNAALIPAGPFVELEQDTLERLVRVNVLGPLTLLRSLLDPMRESGRGVVVLMSSMSGIHGWPGLTGYAATKAFNTVLGEGLWHELGKEGIDVVASCPGIGFGGTAGRAPAAPACLAWRLPRGLCFPPQAAAARSWRSITWGGARTRGCSMRAPPRRCTFTWPAPRCCS